MAKVEKKHLISGEMFLWNSLNILKMISRLYRVGGFRTSIFQGKVPWGGCGVYLTISMSYMELKTLYPDKILNHINNYNIVTLLATLA